jgi:hypothetical protein
VSQLNDVPDFSFGNTPNGNVLVNESLAGVVRTYTSPPLYVGASPSTLLNMVIYEQPSWVSATIAYYIDATLAVQVSSTDLIASGTAFGSVIVPNSTAWAQITFQTNGDGTQAQLYAIQSAINTPQPISAIRGTLLQINAPAFPVGSTSTPFLFISPGPAQLACSFSNGTVRFVVSDIVNGNRLYDSGGLTETAGAGSVNAPILLTAGLCEVVVINGGTAPVTVSVGVTC